MLVANKKILADTKKTGTKKREKTGKDDILEYGAFDLFKVLDIDGDGRITRKEYNAGFDIIDTDRNGFLSKNEFGMSSAAPFNLLDQDGNGQLSRKEFKAGFDLLDIHGEGFITKEEFNGHIDLFKFLDDEGRPLMEQQQAGLLLVSLNEAWHMGKRDARYTPPPLAIKKRKKSFTTIVNLSARAPTVNFGVFGGQPSAPMLRARLWRPRCRSQSSS